MANKHQNNKPQKYNKQNQKNKIADRREEFAEELYVNNDQKQNRNRQNNNR